MSTNTQCLFPQSRYYGKFTPENLVFNANLQEFSHRVGIICGLETGGKISSQEAYLQVAELWQQLEQSKQNLFT
ncbi:hypothetical protein B9G53_01930 [Pseudanabaena sp. SR411]|jgi:hypothetical protein|uniref:DUF7219 family protein n=1 Tax=Pseudanabaena sp. SR411 TaxID=1980935 RepID=UPI000BCD9D08|nr:hypothetical protein [Pseudanabaena sp. SR411]OYQ67137.1 hypothetical protein B9G53_01930 [Pseudanabaena sp. SR411]